MVMKTSSSLGHGGEGMGEDNKLSVAYLFRQLQQVQVATGAGAAANTNIPIANIKVGDHITSVVAFNGGVPSMINVGTMSIPTNGNVRCTSATAGATLLITYYPDLPIKQ